VVLKKNGLKDGRPEWSLAKMSWSGQQDPIGGSLVLNELAQQEPIGGLVLNELAQLEPIGGLVLNELANKSLSEVLFGMSWRGHGPT